MFHHIIAGRRFRWRGGIEQQQAQARYIVLTEQRASARKILKVRAVAALEGRAPMQVRTLDISANGVSITVPEPMQAGQSGQLSFDLLVEGKAVPIAARVK